VLLQMAAGVFIFVQSCNFKILVADHQSFVLLLCAICFRFLHCFAHFCSGCATVFI